MHTGISYRVIARVVAGLFLFAMAAGMVDAYAVVPLFGAPLEALASYRTTITAGAMLAIAMSLSVVGIAVFLYPIIRHRSQIVAVSYVTLRAVECTLTIGGAIAALLCAFLFHVRLVPRSISTVGLVGYVSLFVSALLVLFGAADTSTFGMLLYLPGAVFEIVLFPGWLIVKGFSSPTSGPTRGR